MPQYNAPAVTLTHDETVAVVNYFDATARRCEAVATALGFDMTDAPVLRNCITAADNRVEAKYGFRIRDMFATVAE
jgi:hypothetical protein